MQQVRGVVPWSKRSLPFALTLALSLWMLFSPGSTVPSGPPGSDKVVHALLFAALALSGRTAGIRLLPLALGLATYAVVSEVLQSVLPINRHGDVLDAVVDLAGVAIGLSLARLRTA